MTPDVAKVALDIAGAPTIAGRMYGPAFAVARGLDGTVRFDRRTHAVTIAAGGKHVVVPGHDVRVIRGRAYVPLRPVAEAFGLRVTHAGAGEFSAHAVVPVARATVAPSPLAPVPSPSPVTIVTPSDGAGINDAYPIVSARFAGTSIVPSSVRIAVDGTAMPDATAIGDTATAVVEHPLPPGSHAVTVDARATDGTPLHATWSFTDTFAFAPQAPPPPPAFRYAYIDRVVTPGMRDFNVVVRGVPGLFGEVAVDGVNRIFPLTVQGYGLYVAHVVVPPGVVQPFAHVALRLQLPDGSTRTLVLPQTVPLVTATPKPAPPPPKPSPSPARRRTL